MMLYPSIMELMKKTESRYGLVIAAAKRAREISEDGEEGRKLDGAKSISMAVDEIASGDVEIIDGTDDEPETQTEEEAAEETAEDIIYHAADDID